MIKLQERDQRILRLAREHRFITPKPIARLFKNSSRPETVRRLRQLSQAGYLHLEPGLHLKGDPLYTPTPLGIRIGAQGSPFRVPSRQALDPQTLFHENAVMSARLLLEAAWPSGNFVPELGIKSMGLRQVPDGIYFFPNGRGVAVEVENSEKWSRRFLRIHERWESHDDIVFVLFVATTDALDQKLQNLIPQIRSEQPFGLIHLEKWEKGYDLVWNPKRTWPLSELGARFQ